MTDLVEFLNTRLNEDEAEARQNLVNADSDGWAWYVSRVLAEVEAKRRIIEAYVQARTVADALPGLGLDAAVAVSGATAFLVVLEEFAVVYADHPDYQREWAL
jgi:Family of unknown function (DUF6221)